MLVRKALSPYQQSLRVENNGALCTDKPMRSKDFYNVFRSQITEREQVSHVSATIWHHTVNLMKRFMPFLEL